MVVEINICSCTETGIVPGICQQRSSCHYLYAGIAINHRFYDKTSNLGIIDIVVVMKSTSNGARNP